MVSEKGVLRVWSCPKAKFIHELEGSSNSITSVAVSEDGRMAVLADRERELRAWSIETGTEVAKLKVTGEESGWIVNLAVSPKNDVVAASTFDGKIRVINLATGNEVFSVTTGNCMGQVKFSPDGTLLASTEKSERLCIWDSTGKLVHRFADKGVGLAITFSPDGKMIAAAADDNGVRVWDIEKKKLVAKWQGSGAVSSLAFSRNGRFLASGSNDTTILIWKVPER